MDEAQGLKERMKNIPPEELKDIYPELHDELTSLYGRDPQGTTAEEYLTAHATALESEEDHGTNASHIADLMEKMQARGTPITEWKAADILAHYSRNLDESDGSGGPDAPDGPDGPDAGGPDAPDGSGESSSDGGGEEPPSVPFNWETHRDKSVEDFLEWFPDRGTTTATDFLKANPDAAHAIGLKSSLDTIHNEFLKLSDEIEGNESITNSGDAKYTRRLTTFGSKLKNVAAFGLEATRLPALKSIHDITPGSRTNVSPVPMTSTLGKLLNDVSKMMEYSLEHVKDPVSDEQQKVRKDIYDKFKRILAKQGITIDVPEIGQEFDLRDLDKGFTVRAADGETLESSGFPPKPVYVVDVTKPSLTHAVDQGHIRWKGAREDMPPQMKGEVTVSHTRPTESVIRDTLESLSPPDDAADLSRMSPDDLAAADFSRMSIDQLEAYRNAVANASTKLNDEIVASGRGAGTAEQQGMLTRLIEADLNAKAALKEHPDRPREITDADRAAFREEALKRKTRIDRPVGTGQDARAVTESAISNLDSPPPPPPAARSTEMDASVGRAAEALRPVDNRNSPEHDNAIYGSLQSDEQVRRLQSLLGDEPLVPPVGSPGQDEAEWERTKQIADLRTSLSTRIPRKFSKSSPSNDPKRLIMSIYNSL